MSYTLVCGSRAIERIAQALVDGELCKDTAVLFADRGSATRRDRTNDVRFTVSGEVIYLGTRMAFAVGCLDRVSEVARRGVEPWSIGDDEVHARTCHGSGKVKV